MKALGPIMHSSLTKVSRAAREDSYSSWHLVRAFVILNGWLGALLHFEQSVSADDDSHVHR